MGADNQQERLDANWIVGFTDGEGCFHVAINRQRLMRMGWQVLPEFRVVQHRKDERILNLIRSYFGFGTVNVNNGDRLEFRVRGMSNLMELVRFFRAHPLRTRKRFEFERFAVVLQIMREQKHLTEKGLAQIARIALSMNRKRNSSASRILRDCTQNTAKRR